MNPLEIVGLAIIFVQYHTLEVSLAAAGYLLRYGRFA
jgi:hypothetical protein